MTLNLPPPFPSARKGSGAVTPGPLSPSLNYTEDLSRFPSESLHSFSFAHQSEDFLHKRQNVLKRSIEFMKDRVGLAWNQNDGIISAQAKLSGDHDLQNMIELLSRARILQSEGGPLTGPASGLAYSENVFEKSFIPRSESPEAILTESPSSSPIQTRSVFPEDLIPETSRIMAQDHSSVNPQSAEKVPTNSLLTSRRDSLKRTYTDHSAFTLQNRLMDAMAQPFLVGDNHENPHSPNDNRTGGHSIAVHGYHTSRWASAAQAIFTTESKAPWTILAANDLACLIFGVTKAEVKKMGILEVIREERRVWLEDKLRNPLDENDHRSGVPPVSESEKASSNPTTSILLSSSGVTAQLLNKPSWREKVAHRAQSDDGAGSSIVARKKAAKAAGGTGNHAANKSRGVLLCGDVVPIQKRNGHTGSASLWVKEKRNGLIWVMEEIHEDVAYLEIDDNGLVTQISGSAEPIWGAEATRVGVDVGNLLPKILRTGVKSTSGKIDLVEVEKKKYFTARNAANANIPTAIDRITGFDGPQLRISSFPHIAGIMVLSSKTLRITSSNTVFSAALFGQAQPDGMLITNLIPGFDKVLHILTNEDGVDLVDGIVIPEHSFRRARAFLGMRENRADAAEYILHPDGLPAKHRDGSEIKIDVQMRVVKSDKKPPVHDENVILEASEDEGDERTKIHSKQETEIVYALWITYSRHLHATNHTLSTDASPLISRPDTPLSKPSPGQAQNSASPIDMDSDEPKKELSHASLLTKQIKVAAAKTTKEAADTTDSPYQNGSSSQPATQDAPPPPPPSASPAVKLDHKKTIDDFTIIEEMGAGAYGQVKLVRYKKGGSTMVIKYVTKKRILVDTWTRDRRLGTVPLEIHVLDFLRRPANKHSNIVEMSDFFEDAENYYIEMIPHGFPGMDLFDYIELRATMGQVEARSIFGQVVSAVDWLHDKGVVHRDVKDENVVLDGGGVVKLIDFGSAAYVRSGPFNVFVGTIDYAAPEVLAGKSYKGPPQDVWALGILLYTIIYKENPFYSIDEITDRDLRVPYIISENSIALIRAMLDRDLKMRLDIKGVLSHAWLQESEDDASEEEAAVVGVSSTN